MNKTNLSVKNHIQNKYIISSLSKKILKNYNNFFNEIKNDIKDEKKTLYVLNKKYKFNFSSKNLKKFRKFKKIAIIGMGGSILGSEAIYNFLEVKIKKKIYFFNDINETKTFHFKKKVDLKKILFLIISKSGNTVETLSNALILKILKKNSKNVIIISEKKNNYLFKMSKKLNLFYLEHKNYIGGRFSVLSEVGIVPAYLMGVSISKIRSQTLNFLKGKKRKFLKESSIKLASIIKSKKFSNLIFLNYSPKLEKFLFWSQQLIAESLGKKNKGLLPIISNVPKDHHSLLQLYLDGPKDKVFHIFSLREKYTDKIKIGRSIDQNKFLNNKSLYQIKIAQKNALIKEFKKKQIPFREFKIETENEEVLGELFSYFLLETVMIAKLLEINPFNQPAVEQVKIYTKELLN